MRKPCGLLFLGAVSRPMMLIGAFGVDVGIGQASVNYQPLTINHYPLVATE